MSPESLFQIANSVALASWIGLLSSPFLPRAARVVSGAVVLAMSVLYAGLILAFWTSAEGGFGSLPEVAALFETPELLLAGWVHYLAFDLFVGSWIVRRAAEERIAFALVVPTLVLTFLFGPVGLLAFLAIRSGRRMVGAAATA
jgi:hypothetical protein